MVFDYAIVGGGVAGASLAHFLKKENANICLIEAGPQLGGVISSKRIDGFLCESAAQSLQSNATVEEILAPLKLEAILPKKEFHKKYIEKNGELFLAPNGLISFFSSDLLTFSAKIRALAEIFVANNNLEDQSVVDFITRRFGAEFAKMLFAPLVHGIWAGDSSKLSMRSSFPKIWEMEKSYGSIIKAGLVQRGKRKVLSFKNGTQSLFDAIAKELGAERVVLNTKITKLQVFNDYIELDPQIRARQVILATEADPTAQLLKLIDPELANKISKVNYSSLGLIHLAIEANSSFGAGFLSVGGRATLGALCSSNAFEARAPEGSMLVTCFVGGAKNAKLADVRDPEIEMRVINELSETFQLKAAPKIINKVFWKNAIPNYELGHFKLQEMVEQFNQSSSRVKLFGSWLNGAGIGSIIENAKQFSSTLKCLN